MFLGIEIGGTKLQLGIGPGDGSLAGLWRGKVDAEAGGEGIRKQILAAVPELLSSAGALRSHLRGVGVGFGGPVDDIAQRVIKSHQIAGWNDFPLPDWLGEALQLPVVLGNDADVACLAEALFGAGRGLSPVFYITVGSGIGGGLVVNGEIYRGVGRGASEIGHLRIFDHRPGQEPAFRRLEEITSGWAIGDYARRRLLRGDGTDSLLRTYAGQVRARPADETLAVPTPAEVAARGFDQLAAGDVAEAARQGDAFARQILNDCFSALAEAVCAMVVLLCPRRVVIGGGVSLMGEELFFRPLRQMAAERIFPPFADLTEIVPSALGEAVVVHGALALARKRLKG
jgi:glucokinase